MTFKLNLKKYVRRLQILVHNGFISKVHIFFIGNDHLHTYNKSTKIVEIGRRHQVDFYVWFINIFTLWWRHNGCDSVSSHQPHDCLLNRLFSRRSKKTSKLRVTGLCEGNSQGTGEVPAQMASVAENVSIWWRHHAGHHFWRRVYIDVVLPV